MNTEFLGQCKFEGKPLVIAFPSRNQLRIIFGDKAFAADLREVLREAETELLPEGDLGGIIQGLESELTRLKTEIAEAKKRNAAVQRKIISFATEAAQLREESGHPMVAATAQDLREMAAHGLVHSICAG